MNERIATAMGTTRRVVPGYLEKTLAQRAGKEDGACGSIYPNMTAEELETALLSAEWEPYSHPAVSEGCTAFRASLSGWLGIVKLSVLLPGLVVTLDDRKGTGKVSAVVEGVRGAVVGYTVLILGEEQGEEVVFTFHPGDPVQPSQVEADGLHGRRITATEAMAMGLETAKIA